MFKKLCLLAFLFVGATSARADYIQQLTCLADNVYFEARGEPQEGWTAVTNVVFNRLDNNDFPKTPCTVIKQRKGNICQFSWVCSKDPSDANFRKTKLYRLIRTHVHNMYKDRSQIEDNTNGALFYHSTKISLANLNLYAETTPGIVIGNHVFYSIKEN